LTWRKRPIRPTTETLVAAGIDVLAAELEPDRTAAPLPGAAVATHVRQIAIRR